jgi:hypothetical protein
MVAKDGSAVRTERVAVIGLDCCEPSLVFDRWRHDLPNLRRLMQSGLYGHLESCLPPITVPAWTCMATGKDPGTLGVYGFRNGLPQTNASGLLAAHAAGQQIGCRCQRELLPIWKLRRPAYSLGMSAINLPPWPHVTSSKPACLGSMSPATRW